MRPVVVILLVVLLSMLIAPASHAQECPQSRLTIGGQAVVTPGSANRIRSAPSTAAELRGEIPAGGTFSVLDGPRCADGFLWWQVNYEGIEGWTVEVSSDSYWVTPVVFDGEAISTENVARLTQLEAYPCPDNGWSGFQSSMDATGTRLAFNCVFSGTMSLTTVSILNLVDGMVTPMTMDGSLNHEFTLLYFSDDERELFGIAFGDPPLFYRWNTATGELLERAELPLTGSVVAAVRAPDGRLAMSVGGRMITVGQHTPSFLAIFDPHTRTILQEYEYDFNREDALIIGLAFNADASHIGLVWEGSRYGFWDLAANTISTVEQGNAPGTRGRSISYLPAANITAAVTGCVSTDPEGGCSRWQLAWVNSEANRVTQTWELGVNGGQQLAFNTSASLLAVGGWTDVGFWDVANDRLLHTLAVAETRDVLFTPDNRRLIVGSREQILVYGIP